MGMRLSQPLSNFTFHIDACPGIPLFLFGSLSHFTGSLYT